MAVDLSPTAMWPGYSSDGTDITIPIADLNGLSASEADATTGDWRAVLLAFCSTAYSYYQGLAAIDRPTALVVRIPSVTPVTTGSLAGTFKVTYSFDIFNVYCDTPDVAPEP